jgi:hypothetical protein
MTTTNPPTTPPSTFHIPPLHILSAHDHAACPHPAHAPNVLTRSEADARAHAERHGGRVAGIWLPCTAPGCGCEAGLFRFRDVLKACVRKQQRCGAGEHAFRRRDALARLLLQWHWLVEKYANRDDFRCASLLIAFLPGYAELRGW